MTHYTPAQKAEAVARSNESGPYAAAAELGMAAETIIKWVKATHPPKCEAFIFDGWRTHPCQHGGVKERDGHRVCFGHARALLPEWTSWDLDDIPSEPSARRWWDVDDDATEANGAITR